MGRRIFIIAVVICLDLAFIMIVRDGDAAIDLSKSIGTPSLTRKPIITEVAMAATEPEQPIIDDKVAVDNQPRPASLRRSVSDKVPQKTYASRKTQNRPERSTAENQGPEKFTDTIIWYERASYVRDDGPVAVTTAKPTKNSDSQNQKKRSLLSHAMPVVKKPYQWIKTLVSKL